jgi:hypothetical protein
MPNRGKGHLPLTPCDQSPHHARVHGSMQAYSRWGCRCKVAETERRTWYRAWLQTPNGKASIERSKARRRANGAPVPPTPEQMARAERTMTVLTWTRRGMSSTKIGAEIGRTARTVQLIRSKLRAAGKLP